MPKQGKLSTLLSRLAPVHVAIAKVNAPGTGIVLIAPMPFPSVKKRVALIYHHCFSPVSWRLSHVQPLQLLSGINGGRGEWTILRDVEQSSIPRTNEISRRGVTTTLGYLLQKRINWIN